MQLAVNATPMARDTGTYVWPGIVVGTQGRTWAKERYLRRYGNMPW